MHPPQPVTHVVSSSLARGNETIGVLKCQVAGNEHAYPNSPGCLRNLNVLQERLTVSIPSDLFNFQ